MTWSGAVLEISSIQDAATYYALLAMKKNQDQDMNQDFHHIADYLSIYLRAFERELNAAEEE